jgi:DNA-binding response OmpR family regulator
MTASRILVVDDEVDINTVLSVTLRRAGYEVVSAADGVEAVEAVERQAPDLILLDIMMPWADGLETLRRIRAHVPTAHVPVIMLTARSTLTDKMDGFERGADDYLAKPFEPAEILARVQASSPTGSWRPRTRTDTGPGAPRSVRCWCASGRANRKRWPGSWPRTYSGAAARAARTT